MPSKLRAVPKLLRGRGPQPPTGARGAAIPIFGPLLAQLCLIWPLKLRWYLSNININKIMSGEALTSLSGLI